MNNILKRILVGVCIALVMMFVHKLSRAADYKWTFDGVKLSASPLEACTFSPVTAATYKRYVLGGGGASAACYYTDNASQREVYLANVFRVGTGCTPPLVLDPTGAFCTGPDGCEAGMHGDTTPPGFQCVPDCSSGQEQNKTGKCVPKKLCAPYETLDANGFCRSNTSPDAPPKPPLNPPNDNGTCPSGSSNVGTDSTGTSICQGTGTPPTDNKTTHDPTTTKANPDGSTTTTDSSSTTNADGSKTTQTTSCTTGSDGAKSCETTGSTGTKADGTQGKSDGKGGAGGGSGDDTCTKHPELNICKNSEVSGGGCNAGVDTTACTGDAISCAILRQQKKEYCENSKDTPQSILGKQMLNGQDPLASSLPTAVNGTTVNVGSQNLDSSGFLGGGACLADIPFQVNGKSFAIPRSSLCPYLLPLRFAVMLLAMMSSFYMLRGVVLRE